MPQLQFEWFAALAFWLSLAFALLYVLLGRTVLPRITHIYQTRQDRKLDDLSLAERFQKEAASLKSEYEENLAKARANSAATVAKVRAEIAQTAAKKQEELEKSLAKKVAESETQIEKARAKADTVVKSLAAQLIPDVVAKIAAVNVGKDAAEQQVKKLKA